MNKRLLTMLFFGLMFIVSCKTVHTEPKKGIFKKQVLVGMTVQSIELLKFPLYGRDGEKWDPMAPFATDPDLYVQMSQLGNVIYKSEVREDCEEATSIKFLLNLPFEIRAYTNDVVFELFDEDGVSSDDNVGYFSFRPYDFEKKNTIELSSADQSMLVRLGVSWIYVDK